MTGGTWYNTHIFKTINGTLFEEFIRNSRIERYNLMCSIDAHDKHKPSSFDDGSSGGGRALPSNSMTEALVSLSVTIDFWLKCLEQNFLEPSNMYFETMK